MLNRVDNIVAKGVIIFLFYTVIIFICRLQQMCQNVVKKVVCSRILANGEIAHDDQFLLWPQCFRLYLTIKLSFIEIVQCPCPVPSSMFRENSAG